MRKIITGLLAALFATAAASAVPAADAAPAPDYPVVWAVGDLCDSAGKCADVARLITADARTDAVLLAGDLAYTNGSKAAFDRFHALFGSKTFASGVTVKAKALFVPGNHEYRDTSAPGRCPYYFTYVGLAKAGRCHGSLATGDQPWKVRLFPAGVTDRTPGAWRILTVDSNYAAEPTTSCNAWCRGGETSDRYPTGLTTTQAASQRAWLGSQCRLADANRQGAIVVLHHPALADGSHKPGTRLGRDLFSVAAANGCELVVAGHDHLYERFTPRNASGVTAAGGATQFLVGTGGHSPNAAVTHTAVKQYVGAGALRLVLTPTGADFSFRSTAGTVIDKGRVALN